MIFHNNKTPMTESIEEAARAAAHWYDTILQAALFALVGILIALGHYLRELPPRPPVSVLIGRALTTGGLAVAAGAALAFVPSLPMIGQIGIAAALASLGTTGVELLIRRVMGVR